MRRMKLSKGLDIGNITYDSRKRVQSIEGVLSLITTSKDLFEKPKVNKEKLDQYEKHQTSMKIRQKIQKLKEKLKQTEKKTCLSKALTKTTPQKNGENKEFVKKSEAIKIKKGRISKKLRRISGQN